MAKAKRGSRRKEVRSANSDEQKTKQHETSQTVDPHPTANPPRRNLIMLIVSVVLLFIWLVFLVLVALTS